MRRRPLPNALDIDLRGGLTDAVTPNAGAALLIEAMRRAGVPAAADRHLPAKRSPKGLGQGQMVETFVLLSALGGECLDDLDHLRRDMGLAALRPGLHEARSRAPLAAGAQGNWSTGEPIARRW